MLLNPFGRGILQFSGDIILIKTAYASSFDRRLLTAGPSTNSFGVIFKKQTRGIISALSSAKWLPSQFSVKIKKKKKKDLFTKKKKLDFLFPNAVVTEARVIVLNPLKN